MLSVMYVLCCPILMILALECVSSPILSSRLSSLHFKFDKTPIGVFNYHNDSYQWPVWRHLKHLSPGEGPLPLSLSRGRSLSRSPLSPLSLSPPDFRACSTVTFSPDEKTPLLPSSSSMASLQALELPKVYNIIIRKNKVSYLQ